MLVTLRCQRVDILRVLALVGLNMLCCDSFVSKEEFNSTCQMSVTVADNSFLQDYTHLQAQTS